MSAIQEWFHENPRARPLLMFALLAVFCLFVGIWAQLRSPAKPAGNINRIPTEVSTGTVPTGSGEDPQPQRPMTAWIQEKDSPLRTEPDLKQEGFKKLGQWEEVFHIHEQEGWDQIRLADGTEGWVQNRSLTFTRPANLDQPGPAEVAVMRFYAAVVRKDYTAAYHFLAGDWRTELDFNAFVNGYSQTNQLRTEITQVIPMGENRFQVDVGMVADEMGQNVEYLGSYVVEKLGEDWMMTAGSLARKAASRPVATPGEPVPLIETPAVVEEPAAVESDIPEPIDEGTEEPAPAMTATPGEPAPTPVPDEEPAPAVTPP